MPISKHEEKMLGLQMQMRENNLELQDYLKELDSWEGEMKKKEEKLKTTGNISEKYSNKLPPVRNSSKKKKKKKDGDEKKDPISKPARIKSSDYAAWEKFDVDKACEEVFNEQASSDSEFCESDEELEDEMQKQQALTHKDKGNEFFKLGNYAMAIDHYSAGLQFDPTNALILANRAMALLKQEKFAAAEQDCYSCLSLDPTYVKGYLRRASARIGLKKYEEAIADYEKVLKFEPTNKMANAEIKRLQKLLSNSKESSDADPEEGLGVVSVIDKTPTERSKKPLRRIEIQEIGIEDKSAEIKEQIEKVKETRSQIQKDLANREGQSFEQFVQPKNTTTSTTTTAASSQDAMLVDEKKESCVCETNERVESPVEASISSAASVSLPSSSSLSPPVSNVADFSQKVSGNCDPVPTAHFQYHWPQLKKDPQEMHSYLKKILPEQYPKIVTQFVDSEMVTKICSCLKTFFLPENSKLVFEHLKYLSQVNRFQMAVMFLSSSETKVIKDLFSELQKFPELDKNQLTTIGRQYGLK